MILLSVFIPAINFVLFVLFSRYTTSRCLVSFTIFTMTAALINLLAHARFFVEGNSLSTTLGTWTSSGLFELNWNFSIDALTYVMLIVVLTVATLVHLYSTEYMSEDPHLPRFLSYLSLFTFFMLLLITADNFIGLFLGWEGVGLCSYLLISFWYTRVQANKAAIKAMVVNRIADLAFTLGVLVAFYTFQTVEFNSLFGLVPYFVNTTILFCNVSISPLLVIITLLFLGAMGKSAQLGLHTWLPDAMEGPTPVSALIHAATMVTAGVFLIIRSSYLFEAVPQILVFVTFIGASTAFMAATSGLLQNDVKKVIAYSTCSQLGYMVFSCGLSEYSLSLFHLANHAFFKALLFLSAGALIHSLSSEQDLRKFGGLLRLLPYTYAMFLIGSLALMGFPFLTGFYSKDIVIEVAAGAVTISGAFAHWLGLISAFFTAFYSFRLLFLAFYGTSRSARPYLLHTHELPIRMAISLAVLAIGSIFLGYFTRDLFIGLGTNFWNGTIYVSQAQAGGQLAGEFLPVWIKLLPLAVSILGVALVFVFNTYLPVHSFAISEFATLRGLHRFFTRKWFFDTVYNRLVNQPVLEIAYSRIFKMIDKGLLEFIGPTSAGQMLTRVGFKVTTAQTGRVYEYALFMYAAIYVYMIVLLWV